LGNEGSMAKLLQVHCTRDTLLIWKWAIGHPFAPGGATFLPTHYCVHVGVCAPFFPREIASNFKNGISGVSHSVLLTLFSQSGSLLSRSRHAPFPRHAWAPPLRNREKKNHQISSFFVFELRTTNQHYIPSSRIFIHHGTG
jgi:hypothetical protein